MALIGLDNVKKAIDERVMNINNKVKGIYLQGLGNIKVGTPKDEATAQRAWRFSVGSPSSSKSGNTVNLPEWVLDKKLYYTNNTDYIGVLEYGGYRGLGSKTAMKAGRIYSDQAPGGWVRAEMIRMKNGLNKI